MLLHVLLQAAEEEWPQDRVEALNQHQVHLLGAWRHKNGASARSQQGHEHTLSLGRGEPEAAIPSTMLCTGRENHS